MQNNTLEYDNQLYIYILKYWIKKLKQKIFFPISLDQKRGAHYTLEHLYMAKYGK